ncbi:MAG: response regulator transcription factor [Acidobacteria bacterium]|nr:response regulator transcription factor [Acidobacteriota bacterium]
MKPIRILLADDHTLVRAGIRALLQNCPDMEVVAEAANGRDGLRLIEKEHPDVALIDIAMPGLNGLDMVARSVREFPQVRIIMLSMHSSEEYVWQALRSGASGYLLKGAATEELELAIRSVHRGETYLSPAVSKHVVAEYIQRTGGETGLPTELTSRQREILQLIAEGHTTKDIAQILHVSVKTVETHRAQLMERLDIHDIPGLVRYAIRAGLITTEE